MESITCRVDSQGRITLPAEWRKSHHIQAGGEVAVLIHEDRLEVETIEQSLKDARGLVAQYRRSISVVDELISDRRREAERETLEASRIGEGIR
jgi:AbrB family looped-hinge helix DNA binding protein